MHTPAARFSAQVFAVEPSEGPAPSLAAARGRALAAVDALRLALYELFGDHVNPASTPMSKADILREGQRVRVRQIVDKLYFGLRTMLLEGLTDAKGALVVAAIDVDATVLRCLKAVPTEFARLQIAPSEAQLSRHLEVKYIYIHIYVYI